MRGEESIPAKPVLVCYLLQPTGDGRGGAGVGGGGVRGRGGVVGGWPLAHDSPFVFLEGHLK